ncbi:MAG: RNA polymerase sigma factor [Minisyncoccia bacterium]
MEYLETDEGEGMCDEEILAASLSRPALFASLVRRYEAPFLRKARGILCDDEEARDAVQEAFTKIYLNAKRFQPVEGASFSSWVWRILINTALTKYARRKRRRAETVELDDELWALIPDRDLRQFEKLSLKDEIASVLARIPEPLALALRKFFIEGKSQDEMADEEGVSVGAIKSRVFRAKAEFRKAYETINQSAGL